MSPEQKQYYKDHIFKRKTTIGAVVAILCLASIVHYYTHLQSTPLTNRRRYVALTPEQFLKIAQFECDMVGVRFHRVARYLRHSITWS